MSKYFWVALIGVIIALGAVFALSGGKGGVDTGEFAYNGSITDIQEHDISTGDGSVATIIEYADFQCPACAGEYPILQQVKETYGEGVKIIFRHYPIISAHPQAMSAHRAAEAANRQGQFWGMHDRLFAYQQQWSGRTDAATIFRGYAEEMGLDMAQYDEDLNSDSVYSKINSDLTFGQDNEIASTPTLFLDGEKLSSVPRSLEEWQGLIEGDSSSSDTQEESSNN